MSLLKKASGIALAAAMAVSLSSPQYAHAEGFALQDWSARGAALAGGVVARGGDAAAVAYNPAAITELEGTRILAGGELIMHTNTIVGASGQEQKSNSKNYFAPHGYITHKFNDSLSFGFGGFSRFGLGNNYGPAFFVPNSVFNVELITYTVSPVLAWKVTDKLSLGVGLELSYGDVDFNQKMYGAIAGMTGDAWSPAFSLSAHYRFNEKWKAGFVYRSHSDYDFDGDLTISGASAPLAMLNGGYAGDAKLYTPDSYTLALAYYPIPTWSFEAQVQYNTWSRYSNLRINVYGMPLPQLSNITSIKNWNDTWFFSLSTEYQYNDWLTFRAGASYETSPVDEHFADFIAPSNGRWKYGVGLGFAQDDWSLDLGYVYHDICTLHYGHSEFGTRYGALGADHATDAHAHTVSFSIGYKF